jgi:hypothetical protein
MKLPGEDIQLLNCTLYKTLRSEINQDTMIRQAGPVTRMEEMRNVYNILVRKPERPGPPHRWQDNIRAIGCKLGLDSTGSGYRPQTDSCHGNESSNHKRWDISKSAERL